MVTTEELRVLLKNHGYEAYQYRGEERWRSATRRGKLTYNFKQACNEVLGRCFCCGEKSTGEPSAACFARHEGKDCNCYREAATK